MGRFAVVKHPILQFDGSWKQRWSWVAATLLSMQITDELARIKTDTSMMTYCHLCANKTEHPGESLILNLAQQNSPYTKTATNRSEEVVADDIKTKSELYMPVNWTVERYGYGWSLKRTTEILAAVVLLIHTLLVLSHLIVLTLRRWHSKVGMVFGAW